MVRNSSFELLRIILMFLIIVHHCIVHGLGLKGISNLYEQEVLLQSSQMLSAILANSLCICAVNCFILISGYFGIKVSKTKFKTLIYIVIFYTVCLAVVPALLDHNIRLALRYTLFISHSPYWFIVDYIFLLFFAPLINNFFENCPRRSVLFFISGLLIISCYFGFCWSNIANQNGYTILQFITMYSIGRWLFKNKIRLSSKKAFILYFLPSISCGLIMYGLYYLGYSNLAWRMTFYNNPLLILSALGLFLLFNNIKLESRTINMLAKSSLAIYLVQSSPYISKHLYSIVEYFNSSTPHYIYITVISLSLCLVILSIGIDRMRMVIFKMFGI